MILLPLIIFLSYLSLSNSACPTNCETCDGTKCLTCISPHSFVPSTNTCKACNVANCEKCDIYGHCLICKTGFSAILIDDNIYCPSQSNIENCNNDLNTQTDINKCNICIQGYFIQQVHNTCFKCLFDCQKCSVNPSLYTDTTYSIIQTYTNLLFGSMSTIPIQQGSTTTIPLPYFIINARDDPINMTVAKNWTQAVYAYAVLSGLKPSNVSQFLLAKTAVRISQQLYNLPTHDQINQLIVSKFNQISGYSLTVKQYLNRVAVSMSYDTICDKCKSNYISEDSATCTACSDILSQCQACSDSSTCTSCGQDYYLDKSGTNPSCKLCGQHCKTCQSSTNCLDCYPPYTKSESNTAAVCILCKDPCITCQQNDLSYCYDCKLPYSKFADNGVCYRCDQDSCLRCNSANKAQCTLCRDGFLLKSDKTCSRCEQANCEVCTVQKCYQCSLGYTLNNTSGKCMPCGPGCYTCSPDDTTICTVCAPGSYFYKNKCVICPPACQTCDSNGKCLKDKIGFMIYRNKSILCGAIGCKTCDQSSGLCIACLPGYSYSSNKCYRCPSLCQQCSSGAVCTQCLDNLHLIGGVCTPCQGNCKTCDSTNLKQCLTCIAGHNYKSATKQCVKECEKGCQQCSDTDSSKCLTCSHGYALSTANKCIKCQKNCNGYCDIKNITSCLGCIQGYYLSQNRCKICQFGCQSCLNAHCTKCKQGYTLITNSSNYRVCVQSCNFPCIDCSNSACIKCADAYNLVSGKCQPDTSCSPKCKFCPLRSYFSSSGTCALCSNNLCATCPSGICNACIDGYYLDGTTCKVCPSKCMSCYNADVCKICAKGYTKQLLVLGNQLSTTAFNDTCIPCDTNCVTCELMPDRCTTCDNQKFLVGFRCVNKYTVRFEYKLDFVYSTFLSTAESQKFLQKVALLANVSIDDVYLSNIVEGSTIISGMIKSNDELDARKIQSSLKSSPTGYTILSSTPTVYYWEDPQANPQPNPQPNPPDSITPQQSSSSSQQQKRRTNVGLIVGVTIGSVVAAFTVGILIFIIIRKKRQSQNVRVQDNTFTKDKIAVSINDTNDKIKQQDHLPANISNNNIKTNAAQKQITITRID